MTESTAPSQEEKKYDPGAHHYGAVPLESIRDPVEDMPLLDIRVTMLKIFLCLGVEF